MKKVLMWLDDNLEILLCGLLLTAITVVMSIQVIMRYLVGQALPWPEELSRYCYIWITFLSIGLTIRTGSYFRVTAIIDLLPEKLHKVMEIFCHLVNLVFFGACAYVSIDIIATVYNSTQSSPAMRIPMYFVYLVFPVGMFISVFRTIQMLYLNIRALITGNDLKGAQTEAESIIEAIESENNDKEDQV